MAEKKAVAWAWVEARGTDHFTIMLLLGGTCLTDCIELAHYAQEIGIDAVSFTSPFYFKPANAGALAACCRLVAGAVPDLPFYYYHIPVLNGCNLPMISLLKEVADIPNFKGIKYTHEDFMDFQTCINFNGGKYDMLWGRDENMLAALAVGAKGAVGSTFNYASPLYLDLICAYEANDKDRARKLQQQSINMITLLGKYGGLATGKSYMRLVGLDCGGFRLPVQNMDETSFLKFKSDAFTVGFGEFCSKRVK